MKSFDEPRSFCEESTEPIPVPPHDLIYRFNATAHTSKAMISATTPLSLAASDTHSSIPQLPIRCSLSVGGVGAFPSATPLSLPAFSSLLTRELRRQGAGAAWAARLISHIRLARGRSVTRAATASTTHDISDEDEDISSLPTKNSGFSPPPTKPQPVSSAVPPSATTTASGAELTASTEDTDVLVVQYDFSHLGCTDAVVRGLCEALLRTPKGLLMEWEGDVSVLSSDPPRPSSSPLTQREKPKERWSLMLSHNGLSDGCVSHLLLLLQSQQDRWVCSPSTASVSVAMTEKKEEESGVQHLKQQNQQQNGGEPPAITADSSLFLDEPLHWNDLCEGNHFSQGSMNQIREALREITVMAGTRGDVTPPSQLRASLERREAERACEEGVEGLWKGIGRSSLEYDDRDTNNKAGPPVTRMSRGEQRMDGGHDDKYGNRTMKKAAEDEEPDKPRGTSGVMGTEGKKDESVDGVALMSHSTAYLERYRKLLSTSSPAVEPSPSVVSDSGTEAEETWSRYTAASRVRGGQGTSSATIAVQQREPSSTSGSVHRRVHDQPTRHRDPDVGHSKEDVRDAVVVEMSEDDEEKEKEEEQGRSRGLHHVRVRDHDERSRNDDFRPPPPPRPPTSSERGRGEISGTEDLLVYRYLSPWLKGGVVNLSNLVVTTTSGGDGEPGREEEKEREGNQGRLTAEAAAHWRQVLQHTLEETEAIGGNGKSTSKEWEEEEEKEEKIQNANAHRAASTRKVMDTVWDVLGGLIRHTERVRHARSGPPPSALSSSFLTDLSLLTVLDLSHNSLTAVPPGVLPNTLLRLDLSHNALRSLDGGAWLKPCRMLAVLNLRHNCLGESTGDHEGEDPTTKEFPLLGAFEYTPHLSHLFLGHNAIRSLDGISGPLLLFLHTLDVSHNQLEDPQVLRPLSLVTSLFHLILRGNPICAAPRPGYPRTDGADTTMSAWWAGNTTSMQDQDTTQLTSFTTTSHGSRASRPPAHPMKAIIRHLCPQLAFLDDIPLLHGAATAAGFPSPHPTTGVVAASAASQPGERGYSAQTSRLAATTMTAPAKVQQRGFRDGASEDFSQRTTATWTSSGEGAEALGQLQKSSKSAGGKTQHSVSSLDYSTRAHEHARQLAVKQYFISKQKEATAAQRRSVIMEQLSSTEKTNASDKGVVPLAGGATRRKGGSMQHLSDIVKAQLTKEAQAFEERVERALSPRSETTASPDHRPPTRTKQCTSPMDTIFHTRSTEKSISSVALAESPSPPPPEPQQRRARAALEKEKVPPAGGVSSRRPVSSAAAQQSETDLVKRRKLVGSGMGESLPGKPNAFTAGRTTTCDVGSSPPSPRTLRKWQIGLEEESAAVQRVLRRLLDMLEDHQHVALPPPTTSSFAPLMSGSGAVSAPKPPREQQQRMRMIMMADRRAFVEALRKKDADGVALSKHQRGFSLLAPTCIPERMVHFLNHSPRRMNGVVEHHREKANGGRVSPTRERWEENNEEDRHGAEAAEKLRAAVGACEDAKTCLRCLVELVEMRLDTNVCGDTTQGVLLLSDMTNQKTAHLPPHASEKTKREAERRAQANEIEREIYERVAVLRKVLPRT